MDPGLKVASLNSCVSIRKFGCSKVHYTKKALNLASVKDMFLFENFLRQFRRHVTTKFSAVIKQVALSAEFQHQYSVLKVLAVLLPARSTLVKSPYYKSGQKRKMAGIPEGTDGGSSSKPPPGGGGLGDGGLGGGGPGDGGLGGGDRGVGGGGLGRGDNHQGSGGAGGRQYSSGGDGSYRETVYSLAPTANGVDGSWVNFGSVLDQDTNPKLPPPPTWVVDPCYASDGSDTSDESDPIDESDLGDESDSSCEGDNEEPLASDPVQTLLSQNGWYDFRPLTDVSFDSVS